MTILKKNTPTSGIFIFSLVVFITGLTMSILFFVYKITQTARAIFPDGNSQKTITITKTLSDLTADASDESILRGYSTGRINILLLGIAGKNSKKKGELLTDTIMLASIDTNSHRASLMSLPRDLLVETKNGLNKINALYGVGIDNNRAAKDIVGAVELITNQEVHYYLVMDFDGFVEIVDTLGGVNIDVPRTIDDPLYPGPGYSYEPFYIKEGFHKMEGETALKYVRSRHDDPESDFGRAKRQQSVLRALRNKALSIGTLSNPFTVISLLGTLGDHVVTNITTSEVRAFGSLFKKIDTQNITTVVVDAWKAESLLRSIQKKTPFGSVAGLTPRSGDWDEISEYAANIFSLEKITLRRDAIVAEDPTIILINASGEKRVSNRVKTLFAGTGFKNVIIKNATQSETQSKTLIVDQTDSRLTTSLDELKKRIGGTITSTIPRSFIVFSSQSTSDEKIRNEKKNATIKTIDTTSKSTTNEILVILGKDLIQKHAYEPATRESVEKDYKPLPSKNSTTKDGENTRRK